ncbi:MAG: PTS sugar transporter subunit IIA [Acidobacteriia bacterium]|nr:PTS sugar transporter subunit IIA [Terriglobia bacterium]
MRSSAGFVPSVVRVDLATRGRDDALLVLVRDLRAAGALGQEDEPFRRLLEREAAASTALGGGIALPHARTIHCHTPRLAVARLAPALEFGATDGIPVDLVFLLLGPPEAPGEHVRLLSRIAKLAQREGVLAELRGARDEAEFRGILGREL